MIITAEGGDELFCGHNRYRRARWFGSFLAQQAVTRRQFGSLHQINGNLAGWREALIQLERYSAGSRQTFLQLVQRINCAERLSNDLLL